MSETTRSEVVLRVLRDEVLGGRFRPGERLPSERDLASRFETTRGVVRVALKKLEQLGVADVQPGGARVLPLSEASLDAVGHLLELDSLPDPELVDQILEMLGALMAASTRRSVERGLPEELSRSRKLVGELCRPDLGETERRALVHELGNVFLESNDNLVMGIARRSLRAELLARLHGAGFTVDPDHPDHPAPDFGGPFPTQELLPHARALGRALDERDGPAAYEACHQMWALLRRHVREMLEALR